MSVGEITDKFPYDVLEGVKSEDTLVYDAGYIISSDDFRYDVASPAGVQSLDTLLYDVGAGVKSEDEMYYDVGGPVYVWTSPVKRRSRVQGA